MPSLRSLPLPVAHALRKLGRDLALARRKSGNGDSERLCLQDRAVTRLKRSPVCSYGKPPERAKYRRVVNTLDRPEWPLVTGSIIAGSAFPVTAAVGDFHELTARLIEQGIGLGAAFESARFRAVGAEGH